MKEALAFKIAGIIVLILISTHFFALTDKENNISYFKRSRIIFFNEEGFINEDKIERDQKKNESSYFRVSYNDSEKKQLKTVGYYTKVDVKNASYAIKKLSQHVNIDNLPYYSITYVYDERGDFLITKRFKNIHGKLTEYYNYTWEPETKKLTRVERHGMTPYLNQPEVKSITEFEWEGDKLKKMIFYDKDKLPVEKFFFSDKVNLDGSITSDKPEYAVGNNRIFIGYLERYERFKAGSDTIKAYYIIYKEDGGSFLEEKFNNESVLIEEKYHKETPKID